MMAQKENGVIGYWWSPLRQKMLSLRSLSPALSELRDFAEVLIIREALRILKDSSSSNLIVKKESTKAIKWSL